MPAALGQTFVVGTGPDDGTLWGIAGQIDPANQRAQMASLAQSNGLRVDPMTGGVNIHPGQVLSVPDLSRVAPATLADLTRSSGAITAASQQARDANAARIAQQAAALGSGLLSGLIPGPPTSSGAPPQSPSYLATLLALPNAPSASLGAASAPSFGPPTATMIRPGHDANVYSPNGTFDITFAGPDLPAYPHDLADSGVFRPGTTERVSEPVPSVGETDVTAVNTSAPRSPPFGARWLPDFLYRAPAARGMLTDSGGTLHLVNPSGGGDYVIHNSSPFYQEGTSILVAPPR